MHARVTLLEIDTVRVPLDAALDTFQRDVLPSVRAQPGYRGVLVLSTPEGKGMLLSLWDTAEEADAGATNPFYTETLEQYLTLFRSPPDRQRYEVRVADLQSVTAV